MTSMRGTLNGRRAFVAARSVLLALLVVLIGASSLPTDAQTNNEIEEIRKERKAVQAQKAEQAAKVDVVNAELDVLLDALQVMQAEVNAQESRLNQAKSQLADRERELVDSIEEVGLKITEIADLEDQLALRAVASFVTQGDEASPLIESSDPTQAVRMQQLVDEATKTDIEIGESLSAAKEDLEIVRAQARAAEADAELLKTQIDAQLIELEGVRDVQSALAEEANLRLDILLNRLAEIEEQDANLKSKEDKAVAREAARLAAELAKKRGPSGGGGAIPIPAPSEIVTVRGFRVHESIAGNVGRLIDDAAAAGITLGGWGWRDSSTQIRLRKAHCGTSNYAIYEMSASRCSPPTARPGSSMHERGLAIDFTYNGRTIGSRSSKAYKWLKDHAASYGFYNLPSEPWHWSTNGR